MGTGVWTCLALTVAGAALVAVALRRSRRVAPDFDEFLDELDFADAQERALAKPFVVRVVGGAIATVADRVERLLPGHYVDTLEHQLAQAGMTQRRRAGEQLALQLALAAVGAALVPFLPPKSPLPTPMAFLLLPAMGFFVPNARLKRAARKRADAIFKDLPDIVDMLAIAVEAGCGFEAAISTVCTNFHSPLADELAIALQEMALGLPRKEALQQLRDRVDTPEVRTLVLALLQADALGIPVGRILKTQATEVRARRRAWAREKAAKLPIKIMFPLVLFIFPPILALVLGPAALQFGKLGGG